MSAFDSNWEEGTLPTSPDDPGEPASADAGEWLARLGPYRLLRELGQGGQGVVWLAEDTRLGRRVALKVLRERGPESGQLFQRFQREAAVTARLDHPGICSVYETGIEDGCPFIAMRFVEGESLAELIRSTREQVPQSGTTVLVPALLDERDTVPDACDLEAPTISEASSTAPSKRVELMRVCALIEKAARALHAAHCAGVIHRDVKPMNVMVTPEGDPVLLDFGLARTEDADFATLTREGDVFGTPAYMSPEQVAAAGEPLDARTDVYSLGVTLYECLSLQRPFDAPTLAGLLEAVRRQEPRRLRHLNPAVPRDLEIVVATAMDKERDRRYRSSEEFAEDLRRVQAFEPIRARPVTPLVRLQRWAQRNPGVAASVSLTFLALAAGLVVSLLLLGARDRALRDRTAALRREQEAVQETSETLVRYEQMSDVTRVRELLERSETLWPRRPQLVPSMRKWLDEADGVLANLPDHLAARDQLRARSGPLAAEAEVEDAIRRRNQHSALFEALEAQRADVAGFEENLQRGRARAARLESALEDEDSPQIARRLEQALDSLNERLAAGEEELAARRRQLADLEEDPRQKLRVYYPLDDARDAWRLEVLTDLANQLEVLAARVPEVRQRLLVAEEIEDRTLSAHRDIWSRCIADVGSGSGRYAGWAGPALTAQIGLVPLGKDTTSQLWEFWLPESGPCPSWKWSDEERTLGGIALEEDDDPGLVLVLLPGGSFRMGASAKPAGAPSQDPSAEAHEGPVHSLNLDAFLISKYEMTQGQWLRLMGWNASEYQPGETIGRSRVTSRCPVTNIDWHQASAASRRLGLELPTEAQWEYACRAGTSTVYWCGDAVPSIQAARAGNVSDAGSAPWYPAGWEVTAGLDDGWSSSSPAGTFAPNAFGLHDVLGNVWEWCQDRWGSYLTQARPGDGLRIQHGSLDRTNRGGSWNLPAVRARSADRNRLAPSVRGTNLGLRPVLSLR